MRTWRLLFGRFIFALAPLMAQSTSPSTQAHPFVASRVAPVRPVFENYYGDKIDDPYRYMENFKDPEVQAWVKEQDNYSHAVLTSIPARGRLLARIRELDQSAPAQVSNVHRLAGNIYFYQKLLKGEDIAKLYMRNGLHGEEVLLLDPEKVMLAGPSSAKGKKAIVYFAPSHDGKYVAVGIAPGGSENDTELHVIETASRHETGDVILRAETDDPNWLPDNRSFIDGRLQTLAADAPSTEVRQKVRSYLHVLGSKQDDDKPVFGYGAVPSIAVDPTYFASVATQPSSTYAIGTINTGVSPNSAFYIAPVDAIGKSNAAWRKVADLSDGVKDVAVHGDDLYLLTFKDAPRYKVIRVDARLPNLSAAELVVGPSEAVITGIAAARDALYVQLLDGGIGRVLRIPFGTHPAVERVAMPFEGSIDSLVSDPRVPGVLLTMTSWTKAPKIYSFDPHSKAVRDTRLQPVGAYDDPSDVKALEVKIKSYDGALVPLSIVYPKALKLDGSNPTHLTGYGAYGVSQNPSLFPALLALYEQGGVLATCHVRGGGEYGEEWHLAGKGPTKPNTWRDFIACAEYLIQNKYTSPTHLSGFGASAGGILIGRAITERPDLFGAAIIGVGISDMLRFETTSNGVPNIPEFGSTKTEQGFKALYAMSAYHHVKDKTAYPAVLLTTGANDPRVDPWQSAKMTARLKAATTSGKPILLRVDYGGGHGFGSGESEFQELLADDISFELWQLGLPQFQPQKP